MRTMTVLAACAAALPLAAPAAAHVSTTVTQAEPGRSFVTALRVPHGCSGSPTIAIRMRIPAGVTNVKPQAKPGWTIEIKPDEIAWRGGPLPDTQFEDFPFLATAPNTPGAALYFPVVQECQQGVDRWIEIPTPGQNRSELREPAPSVTLTSGPAR